MTVHLLVRKKERVLLLYSDAREERCYPVTIGRNADAHKCIEGDEATPLGEFYICAKNPRSRFLLSMCISYPNVEDAERGLAAQLISPAEHAAILEANRRRTMPPQHTRLGGEIYLHGEEPAAPAADGRARGTRGCIALANSAIRELYERCALGSPVSIVP